MSYLPPELLHNPLASDTDVVGDIEALIVYIETGKAAKDFAEIQAAKLKEVEEVYGRE